VRLSTSFDAHTARVDQVDIAAVVLNQMGKRSRLHRPWNLQWQTFACKPVGKCLTCPRWAVQQLQTCGIPISYQLHYENIVSAACLPIAKSNAYSHKRNATFHLRMRITPIIVLSCALPHDYHGKSRSSLKIDAPVSNENPYYTRLCSKLPLCHRTPTGD